MPDDTPDDSGPPAIQPNNRRVGYKQPPHGQPFAKGDSRINRRGRPKTFDATRREAIKIAGELLTGDDGEAVASRIHVILLDWATSRDVRKQQLFVEYAFGRVPNTEIHAGTLSLSTWQSEIVALLKAGKITADEVRRELGDDLAGPVLLAAGVA